MLLGEDGIIAKAKYANDINATLPIINDEGKIKLVSARHPLIKKDDIYKKLGE